MCKVPLSPLSENRKWTVWLQIIKGQAKIPIAKKKKKKNGNPHPLPCSPKSPPLFTLSHLLPSNPTTLSCRMHSPNFQLLTASLKTHYFALYLSCFPFQTQTDPHLMPPPLLSWRWWKSTSSAFSTAGARTWQQCTWSSKTGPSATTHTKREPSSTSCWDRSSRSSPGTGKTYDSRFVKGSFLKSWKNPVAANTSEAIYNYDFRFASEDAL